MSVVPLTKAIYISAFSVNIEKISDDLLNADHPVGGGKANYFLRHGFVPEHPRIMMDALIEHAKSSARTDLCTFVAKPDRGLLMVIDAMMETPDGVTERPIRSVWQLTMDESVTAVFVTAYPVRQPAP